MERCPPQRAADTGSNPEFPEPVIIIIAFENFYNLLTAPRTVSYTYSQVARAQPCANRVQHIERKGKTIAKVSSFFTKIS